MRNRKVRNTPKTMMAVYFLNVCIMAKEFGKIGRWCIQKSNWNVWSRLRLVPFAVTYVRSNIPKGGFEFKGDGRNLTWNCLRIHTALRREYLSGTSAASVSQFVGFSCNIIHIQLSSALSPRCLVRPLPLILSELRQVNNSTCLFLDDTDWHLSRQDVVAPALSWTRARLPWK